MRHTHLMPRLVHAARNGLQGALRGYDQATNLILADCQERVFSTKAGVEVLALGLYLIRGDNV